MLNNQFSVSLDEVQKIEIYSLFFISLLLVCNEPNMGMVLVAVMLVLFTAISAKGLQQVYHSVSLQAWVAVFLHGVRVGVWVKHCSQTTLNICAVWTLN